jgi:hypothetical protein
MDSANKQFNTWAKQLGGLQYGTSEYDTTANNLSSYAKRFGYNTQNLFNPAWKPSAGANRQTNNPTTNAPLDANGASRIQTRISYLQRIRPNDPEIAKLKSRLAAYNPNPTTTTTTQPPVTEQPVAQQPVPQQPAASQPPAPSQPQPTVQDINNYQSPMTKALMDALAKGVNTMQAYEPKTFEGSPLYQFQKQQGMRDLERLMSARGLTDSGAEIQANSDFLVNLNAQEAEKQRQYADQSAQRAQQAMQFIANYDQSERSNLTDQLNKDIQRRIDSQQFDATRQDSRDSLMVNFLNNILGLQSQSDIARMAQTGLNSQSDLTRALLGMATNNIAANTPRAYAPSGGAPMPPASGQSNVDLARILMNYGNNAGNNDTLNTIIKTLFPNS